MTTRSERLSAARKKGTHTGEEWQEMVDFFGGRCVRCGADDAAPVKDHIVPIYQGGCDSIRNLQPLCRHCNSSKGPENIDYRGDFCLRERLEMPAKWDKNACERLQDACNACVTSGRTPAPRSRNQDPETKINTPPTQEYFNNLNTRARALNPSGGEGGGAEPVASAASGSSAVPAASVWTGEAGEVGETGEPAGTDVPPSGLSGLSRDGPARTDAPSKGTPEWTAFLSCWDVYPVQQGQEEAWREWMRLKRNGTLESSWVIRESILTMCAEDSRWKRGKVPKFARWLNGKGWDDRPYVEPGDAGNATADDINAQAMRATEERRRHFDALRAQAARLGTTPTESVQ